LQLSLREYYIRSTTKFSILSIILFGILSGFSIIVPKSDLFIFETMLFTLAFLHILLVVDKFAWMPFAMTHTVFANGFAIPLTIVSARIATNFAFSRPTSWILGLILLWWLSIIFHFVTSESFVFSYFGGIERQMGMMYRLTIPVYLFAAWQIFHFMGPTFLFTILLVGGILETIVVTLQFLDEEKYVKYPFSYLKSIGYRRYTGTISNPIPVANFFVVLLPLSFVFYTRQHFFFFILVYISISWGLMLSHGRGSYLAVSLESFLEFFYVVFYPATLVMKLTALAVVIAPPIYYLFTPQGKVTKDKLKDVVDFVMRKLKKENSFQGDGANSQTKRPESSNVNRAFIWKESLKAFKAHPFLGYGISNIARALRKRFSRKSSSYFMTQVIDRSHNHYLDLLLEGGITHLLLYLFMLGVGIYFSIKSNMAWIAIAMIGYSFDLLFSFPLQINYFVLMILISISAGVVSTTQPLVGYALLALSVVYVIGLYFSSKTNTAMRYVQIAVSAQKQKDVKIALDSMLSALKEAPFEQRFFTHSAGILESLSSMGNLKLEDLHTFRIWFNASKDFIIKTAEAPDVSFSTMAMVYSIVFSKTKNKDYGNECWSLIKSALRMNPSSLMARKALFTLLTALANFNLQSKNESQAIKNFKQAEAVLNGMIEDFLNAPGANYDLENSFWQAYFDLLKRLKYYDKLKKYFEIYKKRFEAILFTYDIFMKISKVFNSPVAWTLVNTNGVRTLYPVNTVLGPLTKKVWKFSHGRGNELYLTLGNNAKVSENALKPFIDEFKKQKWWTYWKDEGFIG